MSVSIVRRQSEVDSEFIASQLHPVCQRVLLARGVASESGLDFSLANMARPGSLKGLDAALALLTEALEDQWRILVVGDFDADGATSTSVAVLALRAMGAKSVDYLVPNRCLLYTSPSPRDKRQSRMPSSA